MESSENDLARLAEETRKYLRHLELLGVESIQVSTSEISKITSVIPSTVPRAEPPASEPLRVVPEREPIEIRQSEPKPRILNREETSTLFGDAGSDTLTPSNETFEQIWSEIGNCTRCPLHEGRTNIVHTEGNRKARLMFVGEAPGADEDEQARPFVGRAGQLLTKIIEAIGLKRDSVLIGNVNRCRPPGNRPPTPQEASMCRPFLLREIAIVQPKVIVTLGNTAMKNLLGTNEGITKARGKFQNYKGIKVMPTFHPAYLLRDPSKKRETWEDLKKVRDYLG
ncbi:MAG TPA: uracil-DNA glycosylase family protein [Pyrinomonadaceae bacterium]|nr:uracil-DNA glycosylase family protein [Pyrinomonadaceae bacterium]